MPVSFVFAIILLLAALIVLLFGKKMANSTSDREESDGYGRKKTVVGDRLGWKSVLQLVGLLVVLAGVFTANASFNNVGIRNVGIVTGPGHKPTGQTTGAGFHWVAPYEFVDEWNGNYELWDHRNDNPDDAHKQGRGMLVKIAGNQDAYVPVSVEYAPVAESAVKDFKDYARDRQNWIDRRVYPTLDNAVSTLFRDHDPLAKANVDPVTGQVSPPDMTPYKNRLNAELQAEISGFKIRNLYIGTIVYNQKTTESLQTYANLVLDNRNLGQQKINQTLKNDITNSQAKVDPLTYCLQIQEKTGTLCLLAGNGSSPVIVNGTKK